MTSQNNENYNWIWKCTERKGFFSVHFSFVVGLLGLLLFAYGFILFSIQRLDSFHHLCLTEGLELQKNILRQERLLFALNAQSTVYRMQLKTLQAELALLAGTPAAAPVVAQIEVVETLQKILDTQQKMIIHDTDQYIRYSIFNIVQKFQSSDSTARQSWQQYLSLLSQLQISRKPEVAVQPDSIGGIAPNYELRPDYQTLQTLALKWQIQFFSKEKAQRLLKTDQSFSRDCQIIPDKKGSIWLTKIKVDKS